MQDEACFERGNNAILRKFTVTTHSIASADLAEQKNKTHPPFQGQRKGRSVSKV